jgi:hypothetical protein
VIRDDPRPANPDPRELDGQVIGCIGARGIVLQFTRSARPSLIVVDPRSPQTDPQLQVGAAEQRMPITQDAAGIGKTMAGFSRAREAGD